MAQAAGAIIKPAASAAIATATRFVLVMTSTLLQRSLRVFRRFDLGDTGFDRFLHLFKRADLDLAHAFARDAEFLGELLERDRIVGQPPCLEDAPFALVEHVQRFDQRLVTVVALLAVGKHAFLTRRVILEEDPGNAQGKRYVGSAIWKTETVSPGPGLAPELAVRCDVEISERHMRMTWSLRRNTDKALPASHTIEIMFTLPADFSEGGIQNVPGVLMKQNEQARGVPLAGLAVKVTNGFFLVGLNSTEVDVQRNIALLKERPWFDIPIVYNNNKRALLAVEKGVPGERAFEDAFKAWGQ